MEKVSRREYLKRSAIVVGGATVASCISDDTSVPSWSAGPQDTSVKAYDEGTLPIEHSGWTANIDSLPIYPRLKKDITASVVVVGAGLAGSSLALHLAELGVNVVALESRQPAWGASGRNAGHVLPILRDVKLIKAFPDGGKAFLELFREHHTIPFDVSDKYGIKCDAAMDGYLEIMSSEDVFQDYKAKSAFWNDELGLEIQYTGAQDTHSLTGSARYTHGVYYKAGGRINPYLFTNGMINAAVGLGARVYGGSEAVSLEKQEGRWRVETAEGTIIADRVVLCTNAYPTDIVPAVANSFYPLTGYALTTKPLPQELAAIINPGRATLAQAPVDLNPFLVDGHNRIVTASLPRVFSPEDGEVHLRDHLIWIRRTWPEAEDFDIELEHYWTGRTAMRDQNFPGVYEFDKGVYGLMHFNAWGNVMAPLMGKMLASAVAQDRMDILPVPLQAPGQVRHPGKAELIYRRLMIPLARLAQKMRIL